MSNVDQPSQALQAQALHDLVRRGIAGVAIYALVAPMLWLGSPSLRQSGVATKVLLGVLLLLTFARMGACLRTLRARPATWTPVAKLYALLSVATAAAWAALCWQVIAELGPTSPTAVVFIVSTCGLGAGATGTLGQYKALAIPYILLLMAPLTIALAGGRAEAEDMNALLGGCLLFTAFLVATVIRQSGDYWRGLETTASLKLKQHELETASAEAAAATRAKSDFLAAMSHEIRTPMNGVLGVSELLKDTPLSREQRELLQTQESSGHALLRIINDILDFSKVEAGRMELEQVAFDPASCAEQTAELLAANAQSKGLELDLWLDPDLPAELLGDAGRIRQVLLNLAGNAVKFTDEGTVRMEVTLRGATATYADIRYAVRDTGAGIPRSLQSRLFKPFSQVDASINRRHGGTGLGLAICQRLVQLMHGRIDVQSEVGAGSAFWFDVRFPIARARPAAAAVAEPLAVVVVGGRTEGREALVRILAGLGLSAENAPTLSPLVGRTDVDVIVLDVGPRDQHLYDEITRVRAGHPGVRVIAVTTAARRGAAMAGLKGHVESVLVRPVRRATLAEALDASTAQALAHVRVTPVTEDVAEVATDESPRAGPAAARRVLVVEDNAVNQMLAKRFLERAGYEVAIASNGEEGLERLNEADFDAVLMDCQMPIMDGITATERIRAGAVPGRADIPIVAMTAQALEEDRRRGLEAGMNAYLTKPIQPNEMARVLAEQLGERPAVVTRNLELVS